MGCLIAMKNFFALNSPFIDFLTKVANLMLLNVLFLLTCIPIVTIGAALVGLITTISNTYHDENSTISASFFRNVKQKGGRATVIWLFICFLTFLLLVNFLITNQFANPFFRTSMRFFLYCVGVLSLFPLPYIFRITAMTNQSLSKVAVASIKMSINQLPLTSILILSVVLFILLATFSSLFLRIAYGLFLTIGCSLLSLFLSKVIKISNFT